MSEGILIVASKEVGATLVRHLLDEAASVRHVVVGSAEDTRIMEACASKGVPCAVYQPGTQERLIHAGERYRWLLNLWGPFILRPAFLALADQRLNIHPSLAPHCQGSDSSAWCIRNGLPAGVSLLEMDESVDTGMVYAQRQIPCDFPSRGQDLHQRLQTEAIQLFRDSWKDIESGRLKPRPQTGPITRHTRKQTNQDRVVSLNAKPAWQECCQWLLGHDFSPGTTAEIEFQGRRYRATLKLEEIVPEPIRVNAADVKKA